MGSSCSWEHRVAGMPIVAGARSTTLSDVVLAVMAVMCIAIDRSPSAISCRRWPSRGTMDALPSTRSALQVLVLGHQALAEAVEHEARESG
ncbi:hypothetical protein SAMD00023353_2901010 [Rosellinia necatrix]|uniref:Uncharacterized protein n=1 Tax=Rosellinia necatrix TaxID=77044 RepID=A0A1W2TJN9_ROSNE|nr:hypothetical protein SAMD00023353_2901010 [Rosellinia necatrix]